MSDETGSSTAQVGRNGHRRRDRQHGSSRSGDEVAFDDPLFEVSTDKVDSEIPSPYDGVIVEILVQPGETVPVGHPGRAHRRPGSHRSENRLPSASHAVAAAGGRRSANPAPAMGGSEGPADRGGRRLGAGRGRGARHHHAQAR